MLPSGLTQVGVNQDSTLDVVLGVSAACDAGGSGGDAPEPPAPPGSSDAVTRFYILELFLTEAADS